MKVLHITPSFYPARIYGGATQSVSNLCRYLVGNDLELRVLTTDANGLHHTLDVIKDREVEIDKGLYVRYCKRIARHSISPVLLRLLPSYVKWADVVHLTAVYSFPTLPAMFICKLLRKPMVWSPRGALQRWSGSSRPRLKILWNFICRIVMPGKIIFHLTSEDEKHESLKRFSGYESVVIPNGVQIPEKITETERNGSLRLLYLGRLDPKKGIENLLLACKKLKKNSFLEWSLTIAGSGNQQYFRKINLLVEEFGLSQQVKMVGEVSDEAKNSIFMNSDIVVVPSYTENFGIVIAEALAYGLPVIAGRGTPWRRLAEKGCGLWIENDPDSLSKAVEQMSKMPLQEMGKRGREWMEKEFSWRVAADRMLGVYQNFLAESR